jgi:hypothetical protein
MRCGQFISQIAACIGCLQYLGGTSIENLPFESLKAPVGYRSRRFRHRAGSGWSNEEITEGVLVASLYACANRFSAAIGLVADF